MLRDNSVNRERMENHIELTTPSLLLRVVAPDYYADTIPSAQKFMPKAEFGKRYAILSDLSRSSHE